MKKLLSLLIIVGVFVVVLSFAKNYIAKAAVEGGVTAVTGLKLKMDSFKLMLLNQTIDIEGLTLKNPKGFEEPNMVDLPKILLSVDVGAFFQGKAHIKKMQLHLAEVAVIRNKDGELNLDTLKALAEGGKKAPEKKEQKEAAPVDLQIDVLELKIGKVIYKDHTLLGKATSQTFDAKIDERFENITDPNVLVRTIIAKALKNTTIGRLANIDMGQFSDIASGALDEGKKMADDAVKQASKAIEAAKVEKIKELGGVSKETADKALGSASESVKDAAGSLKDSASNVFGSLKSKVQKATN